MLKVALVLNTVGALVWTLGVWVAWSIAVQRGIPDTFVEIFDRLTIAVTPDGELYFRVVVMLAIVFVIVMSAIMTLGAVLYNLISDIVGGVEVIVLEETNDAPVVVPSRPIVHVPATNGGATNAQPSPPGITSEDTVET